MPDLLPLGPSASPDRATQALMDALCEHGWLVDPGRVLRESGTAHLCAPQTEDVMVLTMDLTSLNRIAAVTINGQPATLWEAVAFVRWNP